MEISSQQLAELLLGIARAQAGMIQGLENELAGVRSGRIIPALQNVAHLRDHPNPTLTDLPVRDRARPGSAVQRGGGACCCRCWRRRARCCRYRRSGARLQQAGLRCSVFARVAGARCRRQRISTWSC